MVPFPLILEAPCGPSALVFYGSSSLAWLRRRSVNVTFRNATSDTTAESGSEAYIVYATEVSSKQISIAFRNGVPYQVAITGFSPVVVIEARAP